MYIELEVNPFDFGFYDSAPTWLIHAHYDFDTQAVSDITINSLPGTFDLLDSGYKKLMVRELRARGEDIKAEMADAKYGPV